MKMKHFFQGLSERELAMLIDAPGVLKDDLFVKLIKVKQIGVPQKLLLQRLNIIQRLQGVKPWEENLYFTLRGNLNYRVSEVRQAIRKADKYSGYVRNSSSVGTKSPRKGSSPEPETAEWTFSEEIDFFHFLTVGEFSSGAPGGNVFTLMMDQKVRNGLNSKS